MTQALLDVKTLANYINGEWVDVEGKTVPVKKIQQQVKLFLKFLYQIEKQLIKQ